MPPGPKPKDQRLRDLDGNPEKKPRAKKAAPAKGAPKPPSWLGPYALEIWNSLIKSMPPGFYASADSVALGGYCQTCNMIKRASEEIEKNGITLTTAEGGMKKNPACGVLSDGLAKITTLGNALGLTPAARQSIGIHAGIDADDEDESKEGFGDLISISGGKS